MNKSKKCASCEKLIGEKVFVRYPNGTVVHFKCHEGRSLRSGRSDTSVDLTFDPVTKTSFKPKEHDLKKKLPDYVDSRYCK